MTDKSFIIESKDCKFLSNLFYRVAIREMLAIDAIDEVLKRFISKDEIEKIIEKHKKEIKRLENMSEEDLQEKEGYEFDVQPEYYCLGLSEVIDDLEKLLNLLNKKDE